MRVFVTGGTGRVGRVVVEKLLSRKHSVVLLARDLSKARKMFGKRVEVVEGGLLNVGEGVLLAALEKSDVVVHLAALLDFTASRGQVFRENVEATKRLAGACVKANVSKFVFMSSCSIYHGIVGRISEETPPKPYGFYGESKLAAERVVKESRLKYVVLRAPAVYGPGFSEGFGVVVKLASKGLMPVLGSGKNHVALVHVEDLADAIVASVEKKVEGEAFIITDGLDSTQEQALSEVNRVFGGRKLFRLPVFAAFGLAYLNGLLSFFGVKRVLLPVYVETLAEDRLFDVSKARKLLKYKPKYDLRKGVESLRKSFSYVKPRK